ncbi:SDR family NAD(P)-dependent oxidoreductase [Chloroflexota bacterium]
MGRLDGKVALITGAGSGIGRASALLFAEEGAKVAVVDYVPAGGHETVSMVRDVGGEAFFVDADVSKTGDVENMVKTAVDRYGRMDILFNNAGVGRIALVADISVEDWDLVMNTNLRAVFLASKLVIPIMLKQGGGVIISTSSVNGIGANPTLAPYCASKAGVILLTKTVAAEYGRHGIRANCICPGVIETAGTVDLLPMFEMEYTAQGRAGRPEEIAQVALFLASDESSYVNGASLVVDGGWTAEAKPPFKLHTDPELTSPLLLYRLKS